MVEGFQRHNLRDNLKSGGGAVPFLMALMICRLEKAVMRTMSSRLTVGVSVSVSVMSVSVMILPPGSVGLFPSVVYRRVIFTRTYPVQKKALLLRGLPEKIPAHL